MSSPALATACWEDPGVSILPVAPAPHALVRALGSRAPALAGAPFEESNPAAPRFPVSPVTWRTPRGQPGTSPGHSLLLVVLGVPALDHPARGQLSRTLILTQDTVRSCRSLPGDIRDGDCGLAACCAPAAACPSGSPAPPAGPPADLHAGPGPGALAGQPHTLPARSLALCGLEGPRVTIAAQAGRPAAPQSLLLPREPESGTRRGRWGRPVRTSPSWTRASSAGGRA